MLRMFTIYDEKAQSYGTPFFCVTEAQARRSFHAVCNDPGTMPYMYPADFRLYVIANFDLTTGLIDPFEKPLWLANGQREENIQQAEVTE